MKDLSNIPLLLKELTGKKVSFSDKGVYCCPRHPGDPASLHFRINAAIPGGLEIICPDMFCKFHGSIIDFSAWVNEISLAEAVRLFWPGKGPLHKFVFDPGTEPESDRAMLEVWLAGREQQVELKEYMENAQRKFLSDQVARSFLASKNIRADVFPRITPMMFCERPPAYLLRYVKKMDLNRVILFAYRNGGDVVKMEFLDILKSERKMVPLGTGRFDGVYEPDPVPLNADRIIVAMDPIEAARIFVMTEEVGLPDCHPVCLSGPSGLTALPQIKEMVMVSHPGKILSIREVLEYAECPVQVRVAEFPVELQNFDSSYLQDLLDNASHAEDWMADRIWRYFREHSSAETVGMLSAAGLTYRGKEKIIGILRAKGCNDELLLHMIYHAGQHDKVKTLGNATVRRSIEGYFQLAPKEFQVTNFTFRTDAVTGPKGGGEKIFIGTLVTPEFELPMCLPAAVLRKPSELKRYVWNFAMEHGHAFQPFVSKPQGNIDCLDMIAMFDKPGYVDADMFMGITKIHISYPGFRIRFTDHRLEPNIVPEILKPSFCGMYGNVPMSDADAEPMMKMLLTASDGAPAAFRELLGHIAYETAAASLWDSHEPSHVVVPYYAMDTGHSLVVSRLAEMFNGNAHIQFTSGDSDLDGLLDKVGKMNMLPAIFGVHSGTRLAGRLKALRNSTVVMCPFASCSRIYPAQGMWFMNGGGDDTLAPDLIRAIVKTWPSILITARQLLAEHGLEDFNGEGFRGSRLLELFAEKYHVDYRAPDMFRRSFTVEIGTEEIFRILRWLVMTGAITLAQGEWQYKRKLNGNHIGYFDRGGRVKICSKVLRAAVSGLLPEMRVSMLEDCFMDKLAMSGKSERGEFIISKSDWEKRLRIQVPVRQINAEDLGFKDNKYDCIEVKADCSIEAT